MSMGYPGICTGDSRETLENVAARREPVRSVFAGPGSRTWFRLYRMKSSSRYLGSVHISLSTINSKLSMYSRISSSLGTTVSW